MPLRELQRADDGSGPAPRRLVLSTRLRPCEFYVRESSALYQSDLFLGADPLVLHVEELRNPGIEIGVPPSSFSVPPGAGEALVLNPVGEQGYTYAFRLEVDVIVDGSESTEMVDDGGAPFRFGFASG